MEEFVVSSINSFLSGEQVPMLMYIFISVVMFFAGVYGFLSRKNMIMVLISLELMLNAADINFAVFNRYLYPGQLEGHFFALFSIGIAAAETAVAIAIIINIYRNFKSVYIDENITEMKH